MATEVSVSDHPAIHEEVKEEIHVKEVLQSINNQPTEEVKDSPSPVVDNVIDDEKPKTEESPCPPAPPAIQSPVTEETEPITIEEVKKPNEEETPTTEVPVVDKEAELPAVVEEEKETSEPVNIQEETLKTEVMALDNETKSPAVVPDEKKTETVEEVKKEDTPATEVPEVEVAKKDVEKEPEVENIVVTAPVAESEEKITDKKVEATPEEIKDSKNKDCVKEPVTESAEKEKEPIVTQETVATEDVVVPKEVAEIDEKKEDDPVVAKESVPADEIAVKKLEDSVPEDLRATDEKKLPDQAIEKDVVEEPKVECPKETEAVISKEIPEEKPNVAEQTDKEVEPIKTEEPITNTTTETNTNGSVTEPAAADPEKPPVEPVKTEDKSTDETKPTDSTPKEEEKTTPKQSNSIIGKVKKSFIKAKKAITGKNNPNIKTPPAPETKEDEKA